MIHRAIELIGFLVHYGNPRVLLPKIAGTEWDERWGSWPHCNGQASCWMHVGPSSRWCQCSCLWCRTARLARRDGAPRGQREA